MPSVPLPGLVAFDHGIEALRFARRGDGSIKGLEVQTRPGHGLRQVIPLVPAADRPVPDQPTDLLDELEAPPPLGRRQAQPGQAMDVRLVLRIGPGFRVSRRTGRSGRCRARNS